MAEIINLNRFRKKKAAAERKATAAAKRAKCGRSKAEKSREHAERERREGGLDGHEIDGGDDGDRSA